MQDSARLLGELLSDLSDATHAHSTADRKKAEASAWRLFNDAYLIHEKLNPPDADPSLQIFSHALHTQTQRAYWAIKTGNRTYARMVLGQVAVSCINCHTRNESGPQYQTLSGHVPEQSVSLAELGQYYAATRQYGRAFAALSRVIQTAKIEYSSPMIWERALHLALEISVRVNHSIPQTQSLIEAVLANPRTPYFLRQDARQWEISLQEWKQERARGPSARTQVALAAKAKRLLEYAHHLQKSPRNHNADLVYLRASGALHSLLQQAQNPEQSAEYLLDLGNCYESLRIYSPESLHDSFYELCIRRAPHSVIAQSCLERLEQTTFNGYVGSSGLVSAPQWKQKMTDLTNLARPQGTLQRSTRAR